MKSQLVFLLLTLCSISNLYSQKDLRPGYIITLQNDTIYGQINNKSTSNFNSKCEFYAYNSSKSTTYLPGEINMFRIVNDKCFISKIVNIDGEDKTLFLEFLLEGIVNLYFCHYKKEETYFIEKDDEIHKLENNKVSHTDANNIQYLQDDNKYKGMLFVLFEDEPQLRTKINSTILTHKSLINLTKDYHDMVCDDHQCIIYKKEPKKIIFRPYVGYKNAIVGLKTSQDKSQYSSFVLGIDLNLNTFNSNPRWGILIGLNFSKEEFNDAFLNTLYINDTESKERTHRIHVKDNALEVPISIEYTFPYKTIKPFLGIGYSNIFLLNKEAEVYRQYFLSNGSYSYERLTETDIRPYQSGINASAGFKVPFKKSYLQVRFNYQYRFCPIADNYKTDYLNIQSYSLNLGWAFNGNQK